MQNSTESPVTHDAVTKLIKEVDNSSAIPVEKSKAEKIIDIYEDVLGEPMLNRTSDPKLRARHNAFVKTIEQLNLEVDPSDSYDRRVYTTEILALQYLLILHPDNLVAISSNTDSTQKQVDLIINYLDKIRAQSQKYELGKVAIGFEYEYFDTVTEQAIEMSSSADKTTREIGLIHLGILDESLTTPQMQANIAKFKDESNPEEHRGTIREIITKPSKSYYTGLREYMYMGFEGGLAIHETYSGVRLDSDHTEVMDVRAMLIGAGIIPHESNFIEAHPKPSVNKDGNILYFPYFRTRMEKDLINTGLIDDESYGVEWRSYPMHKTDSWSDFANHTRKLHHQWLACNVINAVQKPAEQRSPEDQKLNNIWSDYITEWSILLDDYHITQLPNEQRYLNYPQNRDPKELARIRDRNQYNNFLDQIIDTAKLHPEFKTKSKEIITTLNKRTKEVLTQSVSIK